VHNNNNSNLKQRKQQQHLHHQQQQQNHHQQQKQQQQQHPINRREMKRHLLKDIGFHFFSEDAPTPIPLTNQVNLSLT
jgi:hypothetical protein